MSYAPDHWNTHHEIEFLKGLGSHSRLNQIKGTTRKELLWIYYNSMDKRVKWEYVDKEVIKEACLKMIQHEIIKEEVLKLNKGDNHGMAKRKTEREEED